MPTDWLARLDDYARLLKYDGRILIGWQLGNGDTKRPANWQDFSDAVSDRFLPEKRYVEMALGPDPLGACAIFPIEADQVAATDWLMLVASVNPLLGANHAQDYDHPAFPRAQGPLPALVDFGNAYDNPWLYRSMVQMGERLGPDVKLARLAECVIEDSREDSADRGAAIAVLGYRVLEMRRGDLALSMLPLIEAYVGVPLTDDTPVHVRRWRISLAFLAGRLNELADDRAAAKRWYRAAAEADWSGFSPLLATKSIAAAFFEARIHLADGDPQTALACFRHGRYRSQGRGLSARSTDGSRRTAAALLPAGAGGGDRHGIAMRQCAGPFSALAARSGPVLAPGRHPPLRPRLLGARPRT
ncbi:hypothetical protein ACFSTI_00100 [Rhizorhabdus histidinilytica]